MSTSTANPNAQPAPKGLALPFQIFALLLRAYPAAFRREYGPQMTQLFRDLYRAQEKNKRPFGWFSFWLRTLNDSVQSAFKEHLENLGKENSLMNNLRKDALAVLGCIGIIIVAFLLLDYGRRHEVSSILMFGYVLDAVVMAGVVGNLIVFLLVKLTRLNPVRTAFWTFLIVNALPAILAAFIGTRVSPNLGMSAILVGYVVSFLFWFGLHWMWARSSRQFAVSGEK